MIVIIIVRIVITIIVIAGVSKGTKGPRTQMIGL